MRLFQKVEAMHEDGRRRRLKAVKRIPTFARLDHRLPEAQSGYNKARAQLTRYQRRVGKRIARQIGAAYRSVQLDIRDSGAGYPVDQLLRAFALEYNYRFANSGTETQPINFNYIEAFLRLDILLDAAPVMRLREERDHLFSLQDLLDYATASDTPGFELHELMGALAEGVVYHYTGLGDVLDLTVATPTGRPFAVAGFSIGMGRICTGTCWAARFTTTQDGPPLRTKARKGCRWCGNHRSAPCSMPRRCTRVSRWRWRAPRARSARYWRAKRTW
jgi:hypothetical protein